MSEAVIFTRLTDPNAGLGGHDKRESSLSALWSVSAGA